MGRKLGLALILAVGITLCVLPNLWAAADMTTMVQKNCMKCHSDFGKMEYVIAGNLSSQSTKANAIQMQINNKLWTNTSRLVCRIPKCLTIHFHSQTFYMH